MKLQCDLWARKAGHCCHLEAVGESAKFRSSLIYMDDTKFKEHRTFPKFSMLLNMPAATF